MASLLWFREDLRTHDNTALYQLSQQTTEGIIAVFLITPSEWQQHNIANCRIDFILRNLHLLSDDLNHLNIPLLIRTCTSAAEIPSLLLKIAEENHCNSLCFNKQYEIDESRRDHAVIQLFNKHKIEVKSYEDQTILAPGSVLTKENRYFQVFTPFKKAWIKQLKEEDGFNVLSKPKSQTSLLIKRSPIPGNITGFHSTIPEHFWPAGETAAQQHLKTFVAHHLSHYHKDRDFPCLDHTSKLSPYLAAGIISPRQCLQAVLNVNNHKLDSGKSGAVTWINELIWREFYKHILQAFPRVSMNKPFKLYTDKLPWNDDEKLLSAWQQGQTGFPIVDAGMRQLNQIGWMHNRLRMITAMFLSKILFLDWRLGEKYFMQNLIDGDLAANNGGWQWCASTGTDAVPYFRIFNPVLQSKRFDPEGSFIRQYCPELAHLDNKAIHEPYAFLTKKKLQYPKPIVDYNAARKSFISAFKALRN